jgi:hypothetical protein
MTHWPTGLPTRRIRAQIDAALAHGVTLADIEHEILDRPGVSEDARSALWLYAWGAVERRDRSVSAGPRALATTWGRDGGGD